MAGRPGAVDVMLAGGDGVGSAACRQNHSESTFVHATNAGAAARGSQPTDFGAVQASSHQARLGPECPGRTGVAAETAASGGGGDNRHQAELVGAQLEGITFKILINVTGSIKEEHSRQFRSVHEGK